MIETHSHLVFHRVEDEPALFPPLEERAPLVEITLVGAILCHQNSVSSTYSDLHVMVSGFVHVQDYGIQEIKSKEFFKAISRKNSRLF